MWFSLLVDDPTGVLGNEDIIITNDDEVIRVSNDLKIMPNPVTNTLHVEADLKISSSVSLSIYDLNGRSIKSMFQGYKNEGSHHWEIPIENLSAGTYILKLQTDDKIMIGKFVKI